MPQTPQPSTIAARCAALSTEVASIITNAGTVARFHREARHHLVLACSDLFAIKTSLDITQDDFSSSFNFPVPLLEALSTSIDSCDHATAELHKELVKQTATDKKSERSPVFRGCDIQRSQQKLQMIRSTLDLAVEHVSLQRTSNERAHAYFDADTELASELLEQTCTARNHIQSLLQDDSIASPLAWSLKQLWTSTASLILKPSHLDTGQLENRVESRSDSVNLSPSDHKALRYQNPSLVTDTAPTATKGIGDWLANITTHAFDRHSSIIAREPKSNRRTKIRDESIPSRGTFYTDSNTSGSPTELPSKTGRKKRRSPNTKPEKSLQCASPTNPYNQTKYDAASPTLCSDVSIIHQRLTSDKLAVAKTMRKELTKKERTSLDRELQNISSHTPISTVEALLWRGANANVQDPDFGFLFIRAAAQLSTAVLSLLYEYGADLAQTNLSNINTNQRCCFSAMHAAAHGANLENLRYLTHLGLPIDSPNPSTGETPLHIAAQTPGGHEAAKYLLEMGADVDCDASGASSTNTMTMTPLRVALKADHVDSRERSEVMQLLLAHGADGGFMGEATGTRGKGLSVLGIM